MSAFIIRSRAMAMLVTLAWLWSPRPALAASVSQPPALPAPAGTVANVSTVAQLEAAVASAPANSTIMIAPGTYALTGPLYLVNANDVTIRGATNNRDDVVLAGRGMTDASVPFGIWSNGLRTTIANLTIRDIYYHPIIFNAGAQAPRIYNVHLINAGQQFVKSNPDDAAGGVNNGIVEYSVIEYETTSLDYYTNGVDVHTGSGWIVRNNLFRNITAPAGQLAGPAVLMWNHSSNTIVEGNTFINCQRDISLGLLERTPDDHVGGIVRNNFIYRQPGFAADVPIYVGDSAGTEILHNTVLTNGTYPSAIEYRFAATTGTVIANNLLDGEVTARDGASAAAVANNYTSASASMFVNPAAGDLHLLGTATAVIDKVAAAADAPQDFDGDLRPQGGLTDYGADELIAAPVLVQSVVTVTSPNGSGSLRAGDQRNITFTHNLGAGQIVNLDVSRDGGATWSPIAAVTTSATRGQYTWVVSTPVTARARIRASSAADARVFDMSDVDFAIADRITVTAPNTAVTWTAGTPRTITWQHNLGTAEAVNIDISRDGGATWNSLAAGVPNSSATGGSYVWAATQPATTHARIRISRAVEPSASDVSDVEFTIAAPSLVVTSPNGSGALAIGSSWKIMFTHNVGVGQPLAIDLSRDGGVTWEPVKSLITIAAASGSYSWIVNGPPTSRARIRVSWTNDGTVADISDVNFTIR